jgi:hypothetical protein
MTDRPQGPGWYDDPQDANAQRFWDGQEWTPHRQRKPVARQVQVPVKATPPPLPPPPPSNLPPPPPTQAQPPAAPRVESGGSKVGFVIAGVALLLVIAALVTGRVLLGTFLPGLLLVAAIAIIIAVTVAVRSGQSVARKATFISATVLVVALAVPASLKVVYPVYHHFFNDGSSQATTDESPQASPPFDSPSSQASRDESPQASPSFGTQPSHSSTAPSSAPTESPNAGAAQSPAAHADAQYKITVGGETIDPAEDCVAAGCHVTVMCPGPVFRNGGFQQLGIGVSSTSGGGTRASAAVTPGDSPKLVDLSVSQQAVSGPTKGAGRDWKTLKTDSSSVTKTGLSYKVTGTISPIDNPAYILGEPTATGPSVPFEFDATCPATASRGGY